MFSSRLTLLLLASLLPAGRGVVAGSMDEVLSFNYSVVVLGETAAQYDSINRLEWSVPGADGSHQEITLGLDRPSELQPYTGPRVMRFFERTSGGPGRTGNGVKQPGPLFSVAVPEGNVRDLLIVVIPPVGRGPLVVPVPLPEKMGSPGLAHTLNMSRRRLAAWINGDRGFIEPGGYFETNLETVENYKLRIDLAIDAEEGWQHIVSRATTASPESRLLFLLYQSPTSGGWIHKKLVLPASPAAVEADVSHKPMSIRDPRWHTRRESNP